MNRLQSSARVVVIGGGIGGCSAAYHLASLGVTDVVVLEQAELSSGTTWHSTGNMETYRADPLIFEMVRYAAETYPRIAAQAGHDIGWRNVGRVMYTDSEDRWALMRTLPELGRTRGIDIELLTPSQVGSRLPIIAQEELIGGIWVPSDARVNPTDAVMAFARAARTLGVKFRERSRVLGITVCDGSVRGVVTGEGDLSCDAIVIAAGLWSGDIVKTCGLRLPLHALEHQYLITKPFGVDRNLPLFLSYDDQLYGREEVGGLIIGSLDDHAIALSTSDLPQDFSSSLLNERWEQFEPYLQTAMRRFPALQRADVKMLLNGPESFTPDGQMLLGPIPGVTGLYAACGFNSNGMALAPAAGRFIAEWVVEGAPSADVTPLDVRRFSEAQSASAYLRERVTEIPSYHCRIVAPDEDYVTARDIRRSPLHEQLAAHGARFAAVNAWERPLWFAHGSNSSTWIDWVAEEAAAATNGVLVVDRSADSKYLLVGNGVREWLGLQATILQGRNEADAALALLPGAHGQAEVLVRVLAQARDRCWVTASPDQETRLREWLRRASMPPHIHAVEQGAAYACLELSGPRRASLVAALAEGGIRFDVHEDVVNESSILTMPSESALYLWQRLMAVGGLCDLRIGGHFAQEALRIRRGVAAYGREITSSRLIREICDEGWAGPAASGCAPRSHRVRVLAAFSSPMTMLGFGMREVILKHGRPVGELTSRVRLPGWPATLALGVLDPAQWQGEPVEVVAEGQHWPLVPRRTSWGAALPASQSV